MEHAIKALTILLSISFLQQLSYLWQSFSNLRFKLKSQCLAVFWFPTPMGTVWHATWRHLDSTWWHHVLGLPSATCFRPTWVTAAGTTPQTHSTWTDTRSETTKLKEISEMKIFNFRHKFQHNVGDFVETYISSISSIIHIESKQAMLQYRSHCAMLNKTLSWFFFFSFSLLFSWWEPTPCPMTAAAAAWHPVNELRRRWWIWWTSSACNTRGKQAFSWIKKMYCKAQSL